MFSRGWNEVNRQYFPIMLAKPEHCIVLEYAPMLHVIMPKIMLASYSPRPKPKCSTQYTDSFPDFEE